MEAMASMKDPVEGFETLDNNLNEAFKDFFKGLGNVFGGEKSKADAPTSASSIIDKHRQSVESGGECEAFKTQPHGLFYSTLGAPDAYFGKPRNHVANIMDFAVSKRELRCYDLKKDPKKIAWLFKPNVKFEAEKIWGSPRKLYFKGTWYSGTFKGIWVGDWSDFKGGEFQGTYLKGQEPRPQQQPPQPVANPALVQPQPAFIRRIPMEEMTIIRKTIFDYFKGQK